MTAQPCGCSTVTKAQNGTLLTANETLLAENQKLKTENETHRAVNGALLTANQKLLTENQRLKVEVGTFRLLISQMRLLRERELSESSESESEGEEEDVDQTSDDPSSKTASNLASDFSASNVESQEMEMLNALALSSEPGSLGQNEDIDVEVEIIDQNNDDGVPCGSSRIAEFNEIDDHKRDTQDKEVASQQKRCRNLGETPGNEGFRGNERDDSEGEDGEPDDSIWKQRALWKCAECEKEIRGNRKTRWEHIAGHKKFTLRCPIDGCVSRASNMSNLKFAHIRECHKMNWRDVSNAEKRRMQSEQAAWNRKTLQFERKFFPEKNCSEVLKMKNKTCKQCGATSTTEKGQNDHIAAHLQLKVPCPVAGCRNRYSVTVLYGHLWTMHKKKISQFRGQQYKEYCDSKKDYLKAISAVKHEYF